MFGGAAAKAMSRHARNLGHAKQAKIKFDKKAPKEYEGVQGDMIFYNDKLYLKDENRWVIFTGNPLSDKVDKSGAKANGYEVLPSGVIIQWGEQSSDNADWGNDTEHTVAFPKEFPNECFKVLAGFETTTNIDGAVGISAKSKTGCTFRFDEWGAVAQNGKFVYIAIGN